jgi:hypothetical protein
MEIEKILGVDKPLIDCLNSLVGISRSNCNQCLPSYPVDKVAEITTSTLGLYVDEDVQFKPCLMNNLGNDCKAGGVWDRFLLAKQSAIVDVISDIKSLYSVSLRNKIDRPLNIGLTDVNLGMLSSSSANGKKSFELHLGKLGGGIIHFKTMAFLGKLVNPTEPYSVLVEFKYKDEQDSFFEANFPVVNTFMYGRWNADATFRGLPEDGFKVATDGRVIEVYYELDTSKVIPYDNVLRCNGCQNALSELKPFFAGNELPSGTGNGICLGTQFYCNSDYIACALAQSNDAAKRLIGQMIVARTIQYFIQREKNRNTQGTTMVNVLKSQSDSTYYDGLISGYSAVYTNRYSQFSNDYELKNLTTPCFSCRSGTGIQIRGILL